MRIKVNIFVNRIIQFLLLFLFVSNVGTALFEPIFAVFVTKSIAGASLRTVGFSIAIYAIVKSLLQVPIAHKIDKRAGERDDFYVMLAGAVAGAIYMPALIFINTPWQLYLLSTLNGFGGACLFAAYYSLFSHHADKKSLGFEWSLFSVFGLTISAAVGGALGGVLADIFGFKTVLLVGGILQFVAILLLLALYPLLIEQPFKKSTSLKVPPPQIPIP